jgi:hypothetical protein
LIFRIGGESAEAPEFAEAALDAIALFVDVSVVLALYLAISFGWDHRLGSHGFNVFYDGVRIAAFVDTGGDSDCPGSLSPRWQSIHTTRFC